MKQILLMTSLLITQVAFGDETTPSIPAPVSVVKVGDQSILADQAGMTLYIFDVDTDSQSQCYEDCAVAWPPMILKSEDEVAAPFGESFRTDGARQLTYENHPLYYFQNDEKTGDINGDGLGGVWHIVPFQ